MAIYEHDETGVGPLDSRWTPVLKGDQYCSPSCGGRCKKADYDAAVLESKEIADQLGSGWIPEVYENLGWHWKVAKGEIEISRISDPKDETVVQFEAILQFELEHNYYFRAKNENPRIAVQKVGKKLEGLINKLQRQLGSLALDPIAIEQLAK